MKSGREIEESKVFEALPLDTEGNNATKRAPILKKVNTQNIKFIIANVTVEPVLFFFIVGNSLAFLSMQNLNLDKACRVNLEFDDKVCTALSLRKRYNLTTEEQQIQVLISSVYAWKDVVKGLIPIFLMFFIGAWSDRTGRRKICMLMPLTGELITNLLNILNTYLFFEVPVEWTVFMEVIFVSLTGGWYTMFLGTFSYVSDITSKETRTFRLGLLSMCMSIGLPVGMALSGVLLKVVGYYGVFMMSATFALVNFCYVAFGLDDHNWLADERKLFKPIYSKSLNTFFDFKSLKATFATVFKKGPNRRRLRLCLVLILICCNYGPQFGEQSIMFNFMRYQFKWTEIQFSMFVTSVFITQLIGTLFAVTVLIKKFQVDDSVLGILAVISKISGSLLMAFAVNSSQVYFAPVLEIFNRTLTIATKSIATKIVTQQELGKVFSVFGVTETLMSLMSTPLYNQVYKMMLPVKPGAVFLLSVLFILPALGIFSWFYIQFKTNSRTEALKKRFEIISDNNTNLIAHRYTVGSNDVDN